MTPLKLLLKHWLGMQPTVSVKVRTVGSSVCRTDGPRSMLRWWLWLSRPPCGLEWTKIRWKEGSKAVSFSQLTSQAQHSCFHCSALWIKVSFKWHCRIVKWGQSHFQDAGSKVFQAGWSKGQTHWNWLSLQKNFTCFQTGGYFRFPESWHLKFSHWASDEPSRDRPCVYIDVDGKWKTAYCNTTMNSVCMKYTGTSSTRTHCTFLNGKTEAFPNVLTFSLK